MCVCVRAKRARELGYNLYGCLLELDTRSTALPVAGARRSDGAAAVRRGAARAPLVYLQDVLQASVTQDS